jgi:hypothetical protein
VVQTGVGRERRYCSDTCRALAGRLRRREQDAIALAEQIAAASQRQVIAALLALNDGERRSVRRALADASQGSTAGLS